MEYSLKNNHPLFEMLDNQSLEQPEWWKLFKSDNELYIHIRKDNYINVYYYGGSIAKITCSKETAKASIHQKYLGEDGDKYVEFDLTTLSKEKLEDIKKRIYDKYYSPGKDDEKCSEKWLQGELIINSKYYIDSELQYKKDKEIGNLRIDLIELIDGKLNFIELKRINDGRLRTDVERNPNNPEIIEQMQRYTNFINKYGSYIIDYYKLLVEIRHKIGIGEEIKITDINTNPKLLIINTYNKETQDRKKRISDIEKLLDDSKIVFELRKR